MLVCLRCGQVRLDPDSLARLAGRDSSEATTTAPAAAPAPVRRSPLDTAPPPLPPPPMAGLSVTPAPPPVRPSTPASAAPRSAPTHRPGSAPTAVPLLGRASGVRRAAPSPPLAPAPPLPSPTPRPTPLRRESITPGAPPPRPPAGERSLRFAETVVPFGGEHDDPDEPDSADDAPMRLPKPPTPPPQLRSVMPALDQPELRAAPEPMQPIPAFMVESSPSEPTWSADDIPTSIDAQPTVVHERASIDDSRLPTEEAPRPTPGVVGRQGVPVSGPGMDLRAAVTRTDEPGLGLRAAVTRTDEPGLGLGLTPAPVAREFLEGENEHTERFFTDEVSGPILGGGGGDTDFDDDVDSTWKSKRPIGGALLLGGLIGVLVLGALAVVAVAVMPELRATLGLGDPVVDAPIEAPLSDAVDVPKIPDPPAADEADPAPGAADEPAATSAVEPPKAPEPVPDAPEPAPKAPEPEPEPAGTAEPAPTAPAPAPRVTYQSRIDRGWGAVESNPEAAADAFREALDSRPGDTEASYGLGYAMLKLNQRNGARAYLCSAASTADTGTRQEIEGILTNAGLSCE